METREIYWNIQGVWLMYLLFGVAMAVFGYGAYRQYRLIAIGKPVNRVDRPGRRLTGVILDGFAQLRSLRDRYSGIMHLLFFWGFAALFVGTMIVLIQADLGIPIMRGPLYLYFQSLTLDVVGLLAIVGLLMALFKRFVLRPDRLLNPARHRTLLDDGVIVGLILAILVTGFLLEGMRIAGTNDPWANWSPVGLAVAAAFQGMDGPTLLQAHRYLWWFHLLIAFAFIACIPYSKLRHLVLSPTNIYFRSLEPAGALKPIDIETAETLGSPKFENLTRKQLLDVMACTECGRCQAACPAYSSGQPLSPKAVMLDLRDSLFQSGGFTRSALLKSLTGSGSRAEPQVEEEAPTVAAVTKDALWSCVTCGSCMQQCPVYVEHVPTIVELRRYMVMEQAEYPELMQEALTSMEARGHPFRGTTASRTDWCEGLGVKTVGESGPAEWLYWVGCAAAFDERNQRVARAFATVLQRAGVDFAILGEEEQCTGDAARRIGNEYLYQTMAQSNIETLNRYGIKKIVTTCPHCLNTLKNEYPQFGGTFEVYHHTELIDQLLRDGRLKPALPTVESLTFHDSCYLARYNQITEAPRHVLGAMSDLKLVEMDRNRDQTFCCGAGGGHLWFEETQGSRINYQRADQALAKDCSAIGTSCPFCMIMMTDGVKARGGDREVDVLDVAELVEQATRGSDPA